MTVGQGLLWGVLGVRLWLWHLEVRTIGALVDAQEEGLRRENFRNTPYWVAALAASVAIGGTISALGLGAAAVLDDTDLSYGSILRVAGLSLLGQIAWFPAVLTLRGLFISTRLEALYDPSTNFQEANFVYQILRKRLRSVLGAVGVLMTSLVLLAGAILNAENAKRSEADQIPREAVLIFGLVFTAALALVYLPPHSRLAEAGSRIADAQSQEGNDQQAQLDLRKKYAEALGSTGSALDGMQGSVALLGPLIAGLAASFVTG